MPSSEQVERMICFVAAMDRPAIIQQLQAYRATFPLDFTPDFLNTVPVDRLRHIFVALCLEQRHIPPAMFASAA